MEYIKINAQQKYNLLKGTYDMLPNKTNTNGKMVKAQITIYAGIYNHNKSMFDKGVRNFDKYSLELLEENREKSLTENLNGYMMSQTDRFSYETTDTISRNEEVIRQLGIFIAKKHKYYNEELPSTLIYYWG
jgi:hypothetical protein